MNNTKPRVSIGLPVYNGENFIRKALDSILAQSFVEFELIISDNASTDTTEAICQEYASGDGRIRYCRNPENIGAGPNHHRVVALAVGEYFMWINHDDEYAPEYVERCVEALDADPSVILAYSQAVLIDEESRQVEKLCHTLNLDASKPHERFQHYHDLQTKFKVGKSSEGLWVPYFGLMRADVLRNTALIGSYVASDIILIEELALLGKFFEVPDVLFKKRDHFQRSMKVYRSYASRLLWFDTAKKGSKLLFPLWNLFVERLRLINRIAISWEEKIYCYVELTRFFFQSRQGLVRELIINMARVLNVESVSLWGFKKKLPEVW